MAVHYKMQIKARVSPLENNGNFKLLHVKPENRYRGVDHPTIRSCIGVLGNAGEILGKSSPNSDNHAT